MAFKGLMGVEYVVIIGVALLVVSLSVTTPQENGGENGHGPNGNGGEGGCVPNGRSCPGNGNGGEGGGYCGDGVVDPGEQCDEGPNQGGNGCNYLCLFEECGNGVIDPDEACDDGNSVAGDGCSNFCMIEECQTDSGCDGFSLVIDCGNGYSEPVSCSNTCQDYTCTSCEVQLPSYPELVELTCAGNRCGDGTCNTEESPATCLADCAQCGGETGPGCGERETICPDGTPVSCDNICSAGLCQECTPDCGGHTESRTRRGASTTSITLITAFITPLSGGPNVQAVPAKFVATMTPIGSMVTVTDPIPDGTATVTSPTANLDKVTVIHQTTEGERIEIEVYTDDRKEVEVTTEELSSVEIEDLNLPNQDSRKILRATKITTNIPADELSEIDLIFELPQDWVIGLEKDENIVISKLSDSGEFEGDFPAKITHRGENVYYGTITVRTASIFVVNAKGFVKPPKTCDNDDKCEPPLESVLTCPTDCQPVPDKKCNDGDFQCVGDTLHKCTSGKLLKIEVCQISCSNGICLKEPPVNVSNILFMGLIAVTVVMGLMLAVIFLRK